MLNRQSHSPLKTANPLLNGVEKVTIDRLTIVLWCLDESIADVVRKKFSEGFFEQDIRERGGRYAENLLLSPKHKRALYIKKAIDGAGAYESNNGSPAIKFPTLKDKECFIELCGLDETLYRGNPDDDTILYCNRNFLSFSKVHPKQDFKVEKATAA